MQYDVAFTYTMKLQHILMSFAVMIGGLTVTVALEEWGYTAFCGLALLWLIASLTRLALSERLIRFEGETLCVPNANRLGFPRLLRSGKNLRLPLRDVVFAGTTTAYEQEYLHLSHPAGHVTLVSSMFEDEREFARFKDELTARLPQRLDEPEPAGLPV